MDFEPKTFDPENIRAKDLPAACWYLMTRTFPASVAVLALWWALTAGLFILGQ